MSFTYTTNYTIPKPDVNTEVDAWGDDYNSGMDIIDTRMKLNADAAAAAATLAGTKAAAVHTHVQADITDLAATLAGKAPLASPTFTGTPAAPTAAAATNTTQIATTAFVTTAVAAVSGAAIADNAVTNAKLADMAAARIKGAVSAGDPADLTGTQVTALLDNFTTSLKGLVPLSGGGTLNFLRADGTWNAPPAAGSPAWGSITGTLSSQTDLNTALTSETANAQTGTTYTLVASDAGKMVTLSNASAVTVTVNSSVFSANARVDFIQLGAGQVTFSGSATRRANPSGANKLTGQYSGASIWFISATEYVLIGDITA